MEKASLRKPRQLCVAALALLVLGAAAGCAAKVATGAYQTGLQALARSYATLSFEELETALAALEAESARNPADPQLALLEASVALRQIRLRADRSEVWRIKGRAALRALQRTLDLSRPPADPPDWIVPRAWLLAGDLLLTAAEAPTGAEETLASELRRIGLADAAAHFHGRADRRVEALGRSASGVALLQRQNAAQGWYESRLRAARGWRDLGLRSFFGPSLEELWDAWSVQSRIPEDFQVQEAVVDLDPARHRRSAEHAEVAQRLTDSQSAARRLAFEAFRSEALALFFADPADVEGPPPRLLNLLGAELAAGLCAWQIDSSKPLSPSGVRLTVSPPGGLWAGFAPPIRELTVRLGRSSRRVDARLADEAGEGFAARVPADGMAVELRSGVGVSTCLEPAAARQTCKRALIHLQSPDVLAALADASLLEIEDGFGQPQARAAHQPPARPTRKQIADLMEDFQTHIRRRGFDLSEARRMLWEVAGLCSRSAGLEAHRCRLSVARGFAQLAPEDQRLRQPVGRLLEGLHSLALSLTDAAERAEALLAETEFDLDFGLADAPGLPASTESKLELIRQALGLLPGQTAEVYRFRLEALEAEFRRGR